MTIYSSHVQPVRRVFEHESSSVSIASEVVHIACYRDASSGNDIILWSDILAGFDNVKHVRSGTMILPFLKGTDFKNLEPLRIAAAPNSILDVIVRSHTDIKSQQQSTSVISDVHASIKYLDKAPLDDRPESSNVSTLFGLDNSPTIRRDPAYGAVEAAMENYIHIDKSVSTQVVRNPQALTDSFPSILPVHLTLTNDEILQTSQSISAAGFSKDTLSTIRSANSGDPVAQVTLGDMYNDGKGVPRDHEKAMQWFLKAANLGDAHGQRKVGDMYFHGLSVDRDYQTARAWYDKASAQGDPQADCNIGLLYRYELGVTQDNSKAMSWFLRSANKDNMHAQNHIGVMYEKGDGVQMDHNEAMSWYRRASNQGSDMAPYNIGMLYEHGFGCDADIPTAKMWYSLSAERGNIEARKRMMLLETYGAEDGRRQGFISRLFSKSILKEI
ncbi:hypothetical protein FBU30_004817 [Linnemannia zychae]|nr:hypothetical protein FBU30_004817 [Linnemannia zychae]